MTKIHAESSDQSIDVTIIVPLM